MILTLPNIDPIAFSFGFITIRWYSLAYIFGIISTLLWLKKCNKKDQIMSLEAYDSWISWAVLSIIFGGRLGYVLFYNPVYFFSNPLEIFAFWHGGMSFHGGLIGSIFGMWLFATKYKIKFLKLTDILVIAAPIGLFFGRIANFVNMELYGRPTNLDYGVIFPNAGDLPRHPSQLYEAFLEGIIIFLILFTLYYTTQIKRKTGFLSGLFLILYGSFRILIENFREPDEQIGFLFAKITMGQLLSLPLILFGIAIVIFSLKNKKI